MAKQINVGASVNVAAMLPLSDIQDPAVRDALQAIQIMLAQRSGDSNAEDPARWLTKADVQAETISIVAKAFGSDAIGVTGHGSGELSQAIDGLQTYIKESLAHQILGESFADVDILGMQNRIRQTLSKVNSLQGKAFSLISNESKARQEGDAYVTEQANIAISQLSEQTNAAILHESQTRASQVEAATSQFNTAISQLGQATTAAITGEAQTRSTQDQSLARAINTMWANMGGNSAVIEDGALANSGQSGAQATRWNQVVAAVTDPNTGQVNSTSIRQELNSYASRADGSLNSIYSVRAQVATNGRTVVGGISVAATNGAGSSQGPTIDVGVRADKFFIAATADTPSGATQLASDNTVPFMVLTQYEWIYGKLYAPGVYIKRAVIGEATIGSAQIADWFESDAANNYGQKVFRLNMRTGQMEFNPPTYGSDGLRINNEGLTVLSGGDWVVKIGNL